MAVLYNMEPFEVLKILYGSRTDGIPEEDFDRVAAEFDRLMDEPL